MVRCFVILGRNAACHWAISGRSWRIPAHNQQIRERNGDYLDVAIRIEEFFNTGVVKSINLIRHEPPNVMESEHRDSGPGKESPMEFF